MALWGNNDNISTGSAGVVSITSYTYDATYGGYPIASPTLTGGSAWGSEGYMQVGDVIRIGAGTGENPATGVGGTYYGWGVITHISGVGGAFIASTEGLNGLPVGVLTSYQVTQAPKYAVDDTQRWWVGNSDSTTYVAAVADAGVTAAEGTAYQTGAGWVGVQTYMDNAGELRVKKEILVAMSGITTGNVPVYDGAPNA
tara:strand:- start:70 stop:666 length:597 start_codon:yes stop_codon:yes gene_type:complete